MTFDRSSRVALVVACLTLLASGAGFQAAVARLNVYLEKRPVPLRHPLELPRRAGSWEALGADRTLTEEMVEALGTDQYLDRAYARLGDDGEASAVVVLQVTYYTGLIDAVPHIPDRCLVAGGWAMDSPPRNLELPLDRSAWRRDAGPPNRRTGRPYPVLTYPHPITGETVTVRMPVGEPRLRTSVYRTREHLDKKLYAGYFFIANGETTPSPEEVRSFAFDLSTHYAYYAKVQCSMLVGEAAREEEFVEAVTDLLNATLPELMRCLPDWAEIEAGSAESPNRTDI